MKEKETIEYLDLKHLVPFRNHPFKLRDGEEKEQLLKSIKAQGTIEPLIVRPLSESEYEVISGHRRMEICKELGMEKTACYRPQSDRRAGGFHDGRRKPAQGKHIAQRACIRLQNEMGSNPETRSAYRFNFVAACDKVSKR